MPRVRKKRTSARQRAFAKQVVERLEKGYPEAECTLDFETPFQLLVATILSAQCTDARVNMVTPDLFRCMGTPETMAVANRDDIESLVRTTGFFRNKAKNLQLASRMILEEFGGAVPNSMDDLLRLPGVARKTASVVLGVAFGKADGVVVDTHVKRISKLLGLTRATDPFKVEIDLMSRVPETAWIDLSHRMIMHGRAVCKARRPLCGECMMQDICPSSESF